MATTLSIAGQVVDLDATRTVLNRLVVSVDQPDSLEWGQWGVTLPLAWHDGQEVSLSVDGTLVFKGEIASTHIAGVGDGPIDVGYRALGLRYLASTIPVTNPLTGTGSIQFNLPSTDPNYIAQLSGQSVGEILKYLFDGHATALASVGVVGYNAADLTPLTIVPPTTTGVLIQGMQFFEQVAYFLQNWYAQYVMYIPADGIIRVVDSTAFTPTTFTLDSDPITVGELSRDTTEAFTRVVIRGWAEVEPAYLSLSEGTLREAFTTADKLQWNWYAYTQPGNAIDQGTITALTSTQITVQSDNAKETWGVNYWPNIEAFVQVIDPIASDLSFTENRHITANTALTAGGTSVITMDLALINSGYTRYYVWGQPPAVSNTWRLYDIVPNWVAQHLVKQFPYNVPWSPSSSELVMVNYPIASVCWSPNGQQPYTEVPYPFELLPESGQIRFTQPTVRMFGTLANLEKGGNATDGIPDDIKVLVPYSRGTLTAVCPADAYGGVPQYSGTAYTQDGIECTLYRDYPQWMWAGDESSYQQLACQILATVSNTLVTGSLTWWGKNTSLLTRGLAANIARAGGTTGYESINAAIRSVVLEWPQHGPTPWITHASFSTVRRPFSGDALYTHPMFREGRAFGAEGFKGINMADPAWVAGTLAQSMGLTGEAHNPYLDTIAQITGNKDLPEAGREAGKESLAKMFGDTDAVRKSLGLKPHDDKNKEHDDSKAKDTENGVGGFGMGDFGDGFGWDDGMDWGDDLPRRNRRPRKPKKKPLSRKEALKRMNNRAEPNVPDEGLPSSLEGTVDSLLSPFDKPHSFTGITPTGPKPKKVTRRRRRQGPTPSISGVSPATGSNPSRFGAAAAKGGAGADDKPHSFSGVTPDKPKRRLTRQDAAKRHQDAINQRDVAGRKRREDARSDALADAADDPGARMGSAPVEAGRISPPAPASHATAPQHTFTGLTPYSGKTPPAPPPVTTPAPAPTATEEPPAPEPAAPSPPPATPPSIGVGLGAIGGAAGRSQKRRPRRKPTDNPILRARHDDDNEEAPPPAPTQSTDDHRGIRDRHRGD